MQNPLHYVFLSLELGLNCLQSVKTMSFWPTVGRSTGKSVTASNPSPLELGPGKSLMIETICVRISVYIGNVTFFF